MPKQKDSPQSKQQGNAAQGQKKAAVRRKKKQEPLVRRVYFFRATDKKDTKQIFDARQLLPAWNKLDYESGDHHYLIDADEKNRFCVFSCEKKGDNILLEFGKTKLKALPQLEKKGQRRHVGAREGEGVNESIHAIFFPGGYVGIEFNWEGPRANRISEYFEKKTEVTPFTLWPLLTQRGKQKFERMKDVRGIRFKIPRTQVGAVKPVSKTLHDLFDELLGISNEPDTVTLELKKARKSDSGLDKTIAEWTNTMLSKAGVQAQLEEYVEILARPEGSSRSAWFDFAREHIHGSATVTWMDATTRVIDHDAMFAAIEKAYNDMEESVHNARTWIEP